VLDSGLYRDSTEKNVITDRVGASIVAVPIDGGGFDVYYQDSTASVVRHIHWDDMSAEPSGHPYPVFGTQTGFARDPIQVETPVDASEQAVAPTDGAYGFFTQVL